MDYLKPHTQQVSVSNKETFLFHLILFFVLFRMSAIVGIMETCN